MLKRKISATTAFLLMWSMLAGSFQVPSYAAPTMPGKLVPYLNASLPVEDRVSDLLGRMTLDEKIGQMVQAERASVTPEDVRTYFLGSVLSGGGSFPNGKQAESTRESWAGLVDSYQAGALSTRLGIPILYGVDAVHGQSNLIGATLFPHNIGLGATRDSELVKQIGSATAQEMKASGTNWAFAPTMADPQNIRWGRSYEGFGDNQALVGQMGAAFIQGLQGMTTSELRSSDKAVATAKHFLGEGLTDNGTNQGNVSQMTEQEVVNLDLPMYKVAVDAGVRTIMVSYSSIQGLKMHANKRLIQDVLKGTGAGQLGFTGFVISDYNGVQQITKDWDGNLVSNDNKFKDQIRIAVNAGVDMLMMPSDWKVTITNLKALVEEGKITNARIDDAARRILRVKFESGVFEHPMTDESLAGTFGSAEHRELARQAVRESLVLLKNDNVNGKPILSQLKNMKKIFVAGKSADNIGLQSGGWSITWQGQAGNITTGTTILQGIKNAARDKKTVTYNKHGRGAAGSDVAIAVVGETPYAEGNGDDLNGLKLDKEDMATLSNIRESGVPTIVILVSGRPLIVNDQLNDWAGLVEAWLPGTEGQGVADVLFGGYDFKGKLPVRWPFYTEAYQAPEAGKTNLEQQYILFDYGYGLTKNQATPALRPIPDKPGQAGYVKVEAENYTNQSGLQTESTSDTGGGLNVGYADKGDWLEYLMNVPKSGTFSVDFRYAVGADTTTGLQILNENGDVLGMLSVGNTGGWQNWQTATVPGVTLTQGVQKLKLLYTGGSLNLNWFGSSGFSAATAQSGGDSGTITPQPVIQAGAVENWVTNERDSQNSLWYYAPRYQDGDKKLEQQPNLDITAVGTDENVTTININPGKSYQSMMGIGTSMEESTVYNLIKMSPAKQEELLKKLVSKTDGIGMSMFRLTIGTADFTAQKFYTYDDMPPGETDPTLSHFSIQKDIDYGIIPTLQKIKAINPDVKFFASPWSPPGWMKTTDSMIRGQVKDEYLPVLADYYVKYIGEYKKQGIDIEAMTLQNEPLLEIDYPSTKMPWQQEAELAKLLKKKLTDTGLGDVKLWIFDHNPSDTMNYPAPILSDPANREAVDGTAFHDYGGDLGMMSQLHDMYPEENVYLTERAVWGTTGTDRIAQYFRNWARSYNSWVAMLDSDINTHQWIGTPDPTLLIQDSSNRDNYWLTPEYYFLGHYTKFVDPGYVRIDSNYGSKDKVTNVAFMSPDKKTIVTVVINQTDKAQTFKLVSNGTQIAASLPAKSVATYRWNRVAASQGANVDHTVPGLIQAEDFNKSSNVKAAPIEGTDGGELSALFANAGDWTEYKVTVPAEGDYPVTYRYAAANSPVHIEWTEGESGALITKGELTGSTGISNWVNAEGTLHLKEGTYLIRLNAKDVFNLNWMAIGTTLVQKGGQLLKEGQEDGTTVEMQLINGTFESGIVNYSWQVSGMDGISIDNVKPVDDKTAAITLKHGLAADIDYDMKATVTVSVYSKVTNSVYAATVTDSVYGTVTDSVYGNSAVNGIVMIKAVDDPESLTISPQTLDYGVDGHLITVHLNGGTFNETKVSDITLSGEATVKGVSIKKINYVNPHEVTVELAWDHTPYFGNLPLTVNVPLTAYSDSRGDEPLSGKVMLTGTGHRTEAVSIPGTVTWEDYYQLSGVSADSGKISGFGAGDWADFKINVPVQGKYAAILKVASPNGGGFMLKSADGQTMGSFSIPYQYGSNDWVGARLPLNLQAGEQIIRVFGNAGGFDMKEFVFEPIYPCLPDNGGMMKVEAEGFIQAGQNVIQYGGITNLGYMAAGTTLDYLVTVPQTGYYTVKYRYATAQGGVSVSLAASGLTQATTSLPGTGGWGNYTDATAVVHLDAGEQTIRLTDNGDGFNLDWFQLEPTDEASIPESRAAAPIITDRDGQRGDEQIVTLTANTEGAEIRYTLDGTLPTKDSTLYRAPIIVNPSKVIRAITVKQGLEGSFVSFYAAAASAPKADPDTGKYNNDIKVKLTSKTSGAAIYYTTDGTVPTTSSMLYTGPIRVSNDTTIKAITVKNGLNHSDVSEFKYTIKNGRGGSIHDHDRDDDHHDAHDNGHDGDHGDSSSMALM
ncbi:glycoside hydrolase family 3 N-terminal domain-containing protein [Paenibacillus sediminis]|uniref:beta-glucosidase n=1 Tax=Paenibacillus sediminis TaxID=664909 RepID=A0ABS4H3X4_9BACL|nr:glycoside hydrolase family 3 N-terminal domain-containing protein [Paenibacillus sediminis]MBP1937234.1 beta-glucosidase-like glycosyl hydrolase/O-glycosyl hydrolase [Paenibacillus sediminis]